MAHGVCWRFMVKYPPAQLSNYPLDPIVCVARKRAAVLVFGPAQPWGDTSRFSSLPRRVTSDRGHM